MKTNRIHFYSGITLTVFIGFHLFNHFMSIWGTRIHIELMNNFRMIYRDPIIETFLLMAVVSQIITGTKLFFSAKRQSNGFYRSLQIWTGLYLAVFLLIHVSIVLIGRYYLQLDTNIYFGVAGLNTFPFNIFFIPYYSLAIFSFFGHLSAIHYQKIKRSVFGLSTRTQSNIILTVGVILSITIIYGLTNGFSGIDIPQEYNILLGE